MSRSWADARLFSPGRFVSRHGLDRSQAPPPTSTGGTLSGSLSDPSGPWSLKFTISGADLKRMTTTRDNWWEGSSTGTTITLSGQMSVTVGPASVSYVTMKAYIGSKPTWQWPPAGASNEVRNQTLTRPFNLSYKIGPGTPDPLQAAVSLSMCGGICAGYTAVFWIHPKKPTTTTATKPTTTTKPPPPLQSNRPYIRVWTVKSPWPLDPKKQENAWLPFSVRDKSGKAKVHGTIYEGGELVHESSSKSFLPADGSDRTWKVPLRAAWKGPLYFCMQAENPQGLTSSTPCAFLSFLVDIKRVSNGCGGEGWKLLVWVENYFGNEHTYYDPVTRKTYRVNFIDACDLHDAGYGGMTVKDKINGGPPIDMHTWSRKKVDKKFWDDMQKLCDEQIPEEAAEARDKCKGVGGTGSIGAEWLYNKVREYGDRFFDADLTQPNPGGKTQKTGPRDNS